MNAANIYVESEVKPRKVQGIIQKVKITIKDPRVSIAVIARTTNFQINL